MARDVCCRLAEIDVSFEPPTISDPFTLLDAVVEFATANGLFYGSARTIRARLAWNQEADIDDVDRWLAELVEWGDVVIHQATDCYGGVFDYLEVTNRTRFKRWRARLSFTDAQRAEVYQRDGHKCRHCGIGENLSVDHIVPWSRGGEHSMDNFQTLCRSCNSRKGARVG